MAEQRNKKYSIEFKLYDGTTRSVSIEIPLGEDGGYYIPSIENKNGETLIYFTPSSPDMPAMEPIPVLNLNEAINMTLTQAKESGEFDGPQGLPGDDYVLTEADEKEIAEQVSGMISFTLDEEGNLYYEVITDENTNNEVEE